MPPSKTNNLILSSIQNSRKAILNVSFAGFAAPTSNTTYTPNQFFDVCLSHYSRGAVRLVAYLIRKTLGWCDREGNPQKEQIYVSYSELVDKAGISRQMIRQALDEALAGNFIECVQEGRANALGRAGCSALYQLRWDASPEYRKKIGEFAGFFEGEGNRTDIPNQFFDAIIPNEPLSVIKVVGSVIRFSIGFQAKHGRRRQQATLSYKEIARYAQIGSFEDLSSAIRTALKLNYLVRLDEGVFSHRRTERKPAVYALRWADGWNGQKSVAASEASEKRSSNGQNSVAEEQSENRSSIQTKLINETNKQQDAADRGNAEDLLRKAGFGGKVAASIAESEPLSIVEQQIDWIDLRMPAKNRLGMLRMAIEQNWPEPAKVGTSQLSEKPGYAFAQHFYAGFAGNAAAPVNVPSLRDVEAAETFVQRLLTIAPDASHVSVWGREFGKLARGQGKPFPSLQLALRQLGDQFFVRFQSDVARQRKEQVENARTAHASQYAPAYEQYLLTEERRCQIERPEDYARFTSHRSVERERIASDRTPWSRDPKWLQLFDSEASLVHDFQKFFKLPDFWQWDAFINPNSLKS